MVSLSARYKQQGAEAVAAHNVFFYMTYEGTVDIDKIADPVRLILQNTWSHCSLT
jgi:hypothetical protein